MGGHAGTESNYKIVNAPPGVYAPWPNGKGWTRGDTMAEAMVNAAYQQALAAARQVLGCHRPRCRLDRLLRECRKDTL